MGRLKVVVVDHPPASACLGDEAGGHVAGLGHRGHGRQSTIRPRRSPQSYHRPLVDELTLLWLMTPEAPDVQALLAQLIERPAWHAQAKCRGMGTARFFPESGGPIKATTALCEGCAVRKECLSAALAAGDNHGIWGGLSARGRRVLRRGAA